jgi:hypothetical protein
VADTRDRILDVTAELFRRCGYTGTGLKKIVTNAEACRYSTLSRRWRPTLVTTGPDAADWRV